MGKETDAVLQIAKEKKWPLQVVSGPQFKLWLRGPQRADWLVIGAHGCSEHESEVNVPALHATKIYFLTQRLAAAPGNPDSWYVNRAVEGGRWSTTTTDWVEVAKDEWRYVPNTKSGLVEVFDTAEGQRPFDYTLTKYSEDRHTKTITDMYEGGARRPFDAITLSRTGTTFSEILKWLSENPDYRYPNIVAGFCNSTSYSKFMTPFGTFVPEGAYQRQGMRDPNKPLPVLPPAPPQPAGGSMARPNKPLPAFSPVPPPPVLGAHGGPPKKPLPEFLPPPPPPPGQGAAAGRATKPLPVPLPPRPAGAAPTKPLPPSPLPQDDGILHPRMPHGGPPRPK